MATGSCHSQRSSELTQQNWVKASFRDKNKTTQSHSKEPEHVFVLITASIEEKDKTPAMYEQICLQLRFKLAWDGQFVT